MRGTSSSRVQYIFLKTGYHLKLFMNRPPSFSRITNWVVMQQQVKTVGRAMGYACDALKGCHKSHCLLYLLNNAVKQQLTYMQNDLKKT